MKKRTILLMAAAVLLILFVPIPTGTYKDGGTRTYTALTYKVVKWHRLTGEDQVYSRTAVYWFPDNFCSLDELWAMDQPRT